MNIRKLLALVIVSLALSFLVACEGGTAAPAETPVVATAVVETPTTTVIETATGAAYPAEATTSPTVPAGEESASAYPAENTTATAAAGEAEPTGFEPPASLTCIDFRNQIARTLDVEATLQAAAFEDYVNSRSGQGCQVQATVPGDAVASPAEIVTALQAAFAAEGWMEDQSYAADGPAGTATAFSNSDRSILCMLNVSWEEVENSPYHVTYTCAVDESAVTTPDFEAGVYQPLPAEVCDELGALVESALNVDVTVMEAPFEDFATSQAGLGCQITATGTGADFTNQVEVANELQTALEAQGWQVDMMRAADGPTETVLGFERDNQVCILGAGWEPSYDAYVGCTEELLLGCDIAPEEQEYTITLNCAEQ